MNELPHDPNSLADELDRVLPPGQMGRTAAFSDPLVEAAARLSAAPRPTLSPEALARIHARMQAGQPAAPASRSLTRRFLRQAAPVRLAVAAVLLFVVVTGAIFAARIGIQLLNPPTATALPPSATFLPPTLTATVFRTDTATPTPQPPTVTSIATERPQVVPTTQPTTPVFTFLPTTAIPTLARPTETPTRMIPTIVFPTMTPIPATPTVTLTSTLEPPTREPTLPVTIVVEGPLQTMTGNLIVIFDLTIVISPSDPILTTLHIGDVVRVEGYFSGDNQVIVAVHVTVIRNTPSPNPGVEINPADGQVWTDPGNCSNPPPPWAPANGWRRRCQGAASPGNSGGNGMGMGNK